MGSIKTISIIVAANIKGLEAGLGKANKSLAKFASGAARMGSLMSFGITAPLAALGKSAFDSFSKFENGMMKVKAVTGASVGEFKMLTDEAKRLGSTTRFTALQVADLQLVLGRKGFDPTAIKNMEKSILDLALATGEDLSLAAEVTGASINAFQLESSEAARVANTLASAAANSSIQLSTFSTAFGHAGASANAVGMELEELAAMMGVLMDNGIKASKAGTGLRKIFTKLHKEGNNFTEVLDLATQGEVGLTKAMKMAGVTAGGQLLILAKNKKKVAELTEEYVTNTDRLDEMTALMGNTAEDKVLRMQSAIEGMKIEMGALIADAILPVIKSITKVVSKFANLSEGTKKFLIVFGGMIGAIGPVLIGFAALLSIVSPVAIAIGLVVAGIAALTAATWENKSAIEAENDALNILASRAMSANTGTEERKTLIEELNTKYPNFLQNLEDESTTNKKIQTALEGANTAYEEKLRLQAKSKKLQKLESDQADAKSKLIDSEGQAILELNEAYKGSDKKMGTFHTTQEKITRALADMKGVFKDTGKYTEKWMDGMLGNSDITDKQRKSLIKLSTEIEDNSTSFDEATKALEEYKAALGQAIPTVGGGAGSIIPDDDKPPKRAEIQPIVLPAIGLQSIEDELDSLTKPREIELKIDVPEIETMGEKIVSTMDGVANKVLKFIDKWGAGIEQVGAIFSQVYKNKGIEIDNDHNKQMNAIEKSSMSEEDKETAMQTLNEETAKKQLDLKRKQAKVDKAMAIFNIINATAEAVIKAGPNPIAMIAMGALGAIQLGVVASQPVPAFAQGGLVTGATMGLVGEGRGTTMSNPEVIAPLDKLKSMLGDVGGGGTIIPDVRISGDDLLIVFDRASRRKSYR